jgi:hypothetical protein
MFVQRKYRRSLFPNYAIRTRQISTLAIPTLQDNSASQSHLPVITMVIHMIPFVTTVHTLFISHFSRRINK